MLFDYTICAPACPAGGAISLIRISGPESYAICDQIIRLPGKNKKKLSYYSPNTIHVGYIQDNGNLLDEVVVSLFKAPRSYTGEDSIEISCHGSPFIQKRILELLLKNGCRLAQPGEFTQRAFLNGKIDLTQAEAVADLIAAESATAHRIAINQMRGGLSREFKKLREKLLHLTSMIELELDFSEEDVEFAKRDELKSLVHNILERSLEVRNTFELGNALKKGVPVAITGKPNVGKSTLLNHLLNDEKAIVSDIAGTTRDAIEDTIILDGILFRFIDTAGIRETSDFIENLGIRKTYQKIETASIILLLADARDSIEYISDSFVEIRHQIANTDKHLILVINKSDLVKQEKINDISNSIPLMHYEHLITMSAVSGDNINLLIDRLKSIVGLGQFAEDKTIISNLRHLEAIEGTIANLQRVIQGLETHLPEDLLAQDLRQAVYHMGTITGEVTTDEILGNIFKNFCIGK